MKKGDLRRNEVIETAERLFYTKGYEKTSVQDILDEMHFSKGGFYHHFDSKLSLLQAICEQRTEETCEAAIKNGSREYKYESERLNAVLSSSALWNSGNAGFVSLLITVAYREDGALMREKMKNSQLRGMVPIVEEIVKSGLRKGEFYSPDTRATAELVLRLYMQFTDDIAFLLAEETDLNVLLEAMVRKLWVYRGAIERILIAPLGSIILFDAEDLVKLGKQVLADRAQQKQETEQNTVNP
ncbi:MAG: TetR/AcrR family transcriptional regulator [Clostridia bacterium]|nr:TetR/AcrR family transcriptional regulator [Clostridia bacterium]